MTPPDGSPTYERRRNYRRALLAVLPLLAIAAFDLVLLLGWGLEPQWAFAVLPPMLFVIALAWIYFGAVESEDRDGTDDPDGDDRTESTR